MHALPPCIQALPGFFYLFIFSVAVNHVQKRSICSPIEQLMHLPLILLSMTAADKPVWSVYYRLSEMRGLGRRVSQLCTSTWHNQLSVSNFHLQYRYTAIQREMKLSWLICLRLNAGARVFFFVFQLHIHAASLIEQQIIIPGIILACLSMSVFPLKHSFISSSGYQNANILSAWKAVSFFSPANFPVLKKTLFDSQLGSIVQWSLHYVSLQAEGDVDDKV